MDYEDFQSKYKKQYHFLFSEFKKTKNADLAYLIELMRAANHIKLICNLLLKMRPKNLKEDSEIIFWADNDPTITWIFNLAASQLREALFLFGNFIKTEFFKKIEKRLTTLEIESINPLIVAAQDYDNNSGILKNTLIPVRNLIFHYQKGKDIEKVVQWIKDVKDWEKERKPPIHSINLEEFEFGPGIEYDQEIFAKNIFWGKEGVDGILEPQKQICELQTAFMFSTRCIISQVLKLEEIPKREFGDMMKFIKGFSI